MYPVLEKNAIDFHGHSGVLNVGMVGIPWSVQRADRSIIFLDQTRMAEDVTASPTAQDGLT
jgi:hypothetical protein